MRSVLILASTCAFLAGCGVPANYNLDQEVCTKNGEQCETTRDRLKDRHWIYRWYYFIAFPFVTID